MNKKRFIIILLVLAIFTLNFSMAQDVDSANGVVLSNLGNSADSNSTDLIKTDIDVVSYTNFNAVGGNFKIKLVDENKTGLASQNVTFDINGVTYDRITDDEVNQLKLEDNWHTDYGFVCPKIQAGKIKFSVTHLGGDYFQATFLDSNGKVASLLPDRTLTYQTDDGSIVSLSVSGGTAVFRVNGVSADIFKATIDRSPRTADYDKNSGEFSEYTGKSPQYSYPSISGYGLYEDIGGNGDGDYIGEGYADDANNGKGDSSRQSGEFTGNSTSSQKADPSSRANGQVNDVSQSSGSEVAAAVASASQSRGDSSSAATSGEKQSVIKQVIIDDEDIFRVTGMSFIVLLILLTIAYYYKDDIKEMKSKM